MTPADVIVIAGTLSAVSVATVQLVDAANAGRAAQKPRIAAAPRCPSRLTCVLVIISYSFMSVRVQSRAAMRGEPDCAVPARRRGVTEGIRRGNRKVETRDI